MDTLNDKELNITFVDAAPPPLPPGDFRITVESKVSWNGGSTPAFRSEYDFSVNGPRYTLDPIDVQAMFPPPGSRGRFADKLPHIVLARRSLPWERTIDGSLPQEPPVTPWLWLMCLDEEEIKQHALQPKTISVRELREPPAGVLGPDLRRETDEGDPSLLVIDVPARVFEALCPSKEDLRYTASVRKVSVIDKEITPATEDEWFSVLMANRFPEQGKKNTQLLVSMEGYGTSKTDIFPPRRVPDGYKYVRLVVLVAWTFTSVDGGQTFDQLIRNLDVSRLSMPAPPREAGEYVRSAFEKGFTALNHITRQGEPTVSWYRGPLLPMQMPEDHPPAFPDGSYPNADAALRFDPALGMFDVSYATAWQVGRLLGLKDAAFATAIARLRSRNLSTLHTLAARSFHHQQLAGALNRPRDFRELLEPQVFIESLLALWGELLGPALTRKDPRPLLGTPADPSGLQRHVGSMPGLLNDTQIESLLLDAGPENSGADGARQRIMDLIRNAGGSR